MTQYGINRVGNRENYLVCIVEAKNRTVAINVASRLKELGRFDLEPGQHLEVVSIYKVSESDWQRISIEEMEVEANCQLCGAISQKIPNWGAYNYVCEKCNKNL